MNITVDLLCTLIKDVDLYRAHKTKDASKYESLIEHTRILLKNFNCIKQQKQIDVMLKKFQSHLLSNLSPQAVEFWHDTIIAIPLFHDIGKLNPKFQSKKMDNAHLKDIFNFKYIGSAHSIISAVLYVDYFKKELRSRKDISADDKSILNPYIMLHSYIIARHHSSMMNLSDYLSIMAGNSESFADSCKIVQEVIAKFTDSGTDIYLIGYNTSAGQMKSRAEKLKSYLHSLSNENSIYMYIYTKILFSLLLAADYYATAEFMSGLKMESSSFRDTGRWIDIYEQTKVMHSVRAYQKEKYPINEHQLQKIKNINELRCEILCEAEKNLSKNVDKNVFFLEAPTGSGKSNTALDLTFQLMKMDKQLQKIYYIYPFNTLVEQNLASLSKIFGRDAAIMDDIAVINSLTPIKCDEENYDDIFRWQKALLDRQFLNYPMILSTHVSLFNTMFGDSRESAFGFHQLAGSIIVLDEIQNYKNKLWSEIIYFLKGMAELLHIKVIIMSATLPNLDFLSQDAKAAAVLLPDAQKYFSHRLFSQRVQISYELMHKQYADPDELLADLMPHLNQNIIDGQKVMLEFITKKTAYEIWHKLKEADLNCDVEYMSGDDSLAERKRILDKVQQEKSGIVLVATQVIEAGVDLDMDVGYKNISKLDSEEQFMGRINRSCLRTGQVYFFKLDRCRQVYKGDVRTNANLTLESADMKDLLAKKDYAPYYRKVMHLLKNNLNKGSGQGSIDEFFTFLKRLDWQKITDRMKLIDDDRWSMQVYLAREITNDSKGSLDGREIWQEYVKLLCSNTMDYAEKRIRLSRIKTAMNNFIYQIKYNPMLAYDEKCDKYGEIYYIEDGAKYFDDNKLNRAKIQGEIGDFVDFI